MEAECTEQFATTAPAAHPAWQKMLVGVSPAMSKVVDFISLIAARRTTVLLSGETGCGKQFVARAIHEASPRVNEPFIVFNCAAVSKESIEAELFGVSRRYAPGDSVERAGRLEQAKGGTLLLDEIGEMPVDLQARFLSALQDREFMRIGGNEPIALNARVVAATDTDLLARVKQGRFREDLYYRLHVAPLRVPALRERKEDLAGLADRLIEKIARREDLPAKTIGSDVLHRLGQYSWPGNLRQFENAIEMAMITSGGRNELLFADFSLPQDEALCTIEMTGAQLVKLPEEGVDFEAVINRIEMNLLEQALQRSNGNKKIAADILRLKRTTLAAKLKSLEEVFPDTGTVEV